jgi:hypothetical protein
VHARTKLVDVYDVRPVNAEEEGLPIGPYCYPSFPPLNQDMQRIAVVSEFSASDVPDISQLVTVDVESISGSARRDSRDSAAGSDSEHQQSNEPLRVDNAVTISVRDDSPHVSDSSDNQNHEQLDGSTSRSTDDQEAYGSNFVSIESIVAPASHVGSLSQHAGTDSGHEDVILNAQEAESTDDSADDDSHDLAEVIDHDRPQDIAMETRPEAVMSDTEKNESSSDAAGEHSHDPAEYEDDSSGSHRFCALLNLRIHSSLFVAFIRVQLHDNLIFFIRSSEEPSEAKSNSEEDFS